MSPRGRSSVIDFEAYRQRWAALFADFMADIVVQLNRNDIQHQAFANADPDFFANLVDIEYLTRELTFRFNARNVHPDFLALIKRNCLTNYERCLIMSTMPCDDEFEANGFWNGPSGSLLHQCFEIFGLRGFEFPFIDVFPLTPSQRTDDQGNLNHYVRILQYWGDHLLRNKIQLVLSTGLQPCRMFLSGIGRVEASVLNVFGDVRVICPDVDKVEECTDDSTNAVCVVFIPHPGFVINHEGLRSIERYNSLFFEMMLYSVMFYGSILSEIQKTAVGNTDLLTCSQLLDCVNAASDKLGDGLMRAMDEKREELKQVSDYLFCFTFETRLLINSYFRFLFKRRMQH